MSACWNATAVEGAKFDRNELSVYIERTFLRAACTTLKDDPDTQLQLPG